MTLSRHGDRTRVEVAVGFKRWVGRWERMDRPRDQRCRNERMHLMHDGVIRVDLRGGRAVVGWKAWLYSSLGVPRFLQNLPAAAAVFTLKTLGFSWFFWNLVPSTHGRLRPGYGIGCARGRSYILHHLNLHLFFHLIPPIPVSPT